MMPQRRSKYNKRRTSRILAVQALYQLDQNLENVNTVLEQFLKFHTSAVNLDIDFFKEIVRGVQDQKANFDQQIAVYLDQDWEFDRLPIVIKEVLRAAVYELLLQPINPTPVIISEYVEITKDFFPVTESAFVHGILDSLAKSIRQEKL